MKMVLASRLAFITLTAVLLLSAFVAPMKTACAELPGAIFTTDSTGTVINQNLYALKTDVYLRGIQLTPGTYYYQITNPDGDQLLAGPFASTHDTSGNVITVASDGTFGPVQLSATSDGTYDTTNNPGCEYKVWITPTDQFPSAAPGNSFGFDPAWSKTDNFKVREATIPPLPPPPGGSIAGEKFYDANANGVKDVSEVGIAGWRIELWDSTGTTLLAYMFTDSSGDYIFTSLPPDTYIVKEVLPIGTWVQTAPSTGTYTVTLGIGEEVTGIDFGNVYLIPGHGGLTLGFWSNKNGQSLITSGDVAALNALNLWKPPGWAYPPFSTTLATAKTQIKTYLLTATAVDMRWMLSAQLIATKLNVLHGFLSGGTIVYVGPSSYVPSGFITINDIMSNANTALTGTDRAAQEYWKNLLDGLNNNWLPFVSPTPGPVIYP